MPAVPVNLGHMVSLTLSPEPYGAVGLATLPSAGFIASARTSRVAPDTVQDILSDLGHMVIATSSVVSTGEPVLALSLMFIRDYVKHTRKLERQRRLPHSTSREPSGSVVQFLDNQGHPQASCRPSATQEVCGHGQAVERHQGQA